MNMNMTMTITTPTTSSCLTTAAITSTCPMPPQHVKMVVAAASTPSPSYNNTQMTTMNWGLETHLCLESPGAFTRWPRRSRAQDVFASQVLGMFFFLLSFFLLLINNLLLDYFYGKFDDHTMNGHHCHDANKGQGRARDMSWSVSSLKYVFFSYLFLFTTLMTI